MDFLLHFLLIHPSSDACGCSHVGVGEKVQLSADVKNNILKALELNPKDSASLHILGIWHFNVANLDFFSRAFVKVCAAHILKQATLQLMPAICSAGRVRWHAVRQQ